MIVCVVFVPFRLEKLGVALPIVHGTVALLAVVFSGVHDASISLLYHQHFRLTSAGHFRN